MLLLAAGLFVSLSCDSAVSEVSGDPDVPDVLVETVEVIDEGTPEVVDVADTSACPAGMEACTTCAVDDDCEGAFDDVGLCEDLSCDAELGVCVVEDVEEGSPCLDADACNGAEVCALVDDEMTCVSGEALVCDNGDLCDGVETCDPAAGCVDGDPLPCDDGDICSGTETCDPAIGCVAGETLVCDDGDTCNGLEPCHPVDGCQEGTALVCDDDDACNGTETCDPVTGCVDGSALVCDDGDVCDGLETCDPATGCVEGDPLVCDDDDACNGLETCDPTEGCQDGSALVCDDKNLCNGLETCDSATGCVDGTALDCDDGNDCTDDTCFETMGCFNTPNDTAGCCDADADCDDNNPCTDDVCDTGSGACEFANNQGACSDGDPCTGEDVCDGSGACVPGTALAGCEVLCTLAGDADATVDCSMSLARKLQADTPATALSMGLRFDGGLAQLTTLVNKGCVTPELCSEIEIPQGGDALVATGHTVYPLPQDAGDWAGELSLLIEHALDPAVPISGAWYDANEQLVDPASLFTLRFELKEAIDIAAPVAVVVFNVEARDAEQSILAVAVPGGVIVTTDQACGTGRHHCFDARSCTSDVCESTSASCSFVPLEGSCDDGLVCTLDDTCDGAGNCVSGTPAPAGSECFAEDLCLGAGACDSQGACDLGAAIPVSCEQESTTCASFSCDPDSGGCVLSPTYAGVDCDDGDGCTLEDACDGQGACVGEAKSCDDDVACSLDSCDSDSGDCVNALQDEACGDDNDCTADRCDASAGCVNEATFGEACDDGDPCTLNDGCSAVGSCAGTWDAEGCGCDTNADCEDLDDDDVCNGVVLCVEGTCAVAPGSVVECPAYAGDCQEWSCNPDNGHCEASDAEPGTSCDTSACQTDASCDASGNCLGDAVSCDDGDPCTTDSCDDDDGCLFEADPACESQYWLCALSGAAGEEVTCPFILARDNAEVDAPVGADFKLSWDPARSALLGFTDDVCMGALCLPKSIPSCTGDGTSCTWGSLFPTGHNIVAVPKSLASWEDHGTLLFFHPSDPFRTMSEAVMDGSGEITDPDATFFKARFRLAEAVPENDPVLVWMSKAHFSLASGVSLNLKVKDTTNGRAILVY